MDLAQRRVIQGCIEDTLDDIIYQIEENRYEPSERGAGTAPMESAIDTCRSYLVDLVSGVSKGRLTHDIIYAKNTVKDIEQYIINLSDSEKESGEWQTTCGLEEIDTWNSLEGVKYLYIHTVYLHRSSGNYIEVVQQYSNGNDPVFLSLEQVSQVVKEEKISYEWVGEGDGK